MKSTVVKCDYCGSDLATTNSSMAWRVALSPERIPTARGLATLELNPIPLDRDYHFCGLACLTRWLPSG